MALKSLPNNLEAEESVLGACFLSKYALQKACESLSEESFYSEKNAKIFASLSSLMDKKIPIDLTTVTSDLKNKQILDEMNTRILSIPGMSYNQAAVIIGCIGDINRFNNPSQVLAFAGLDPSVKQSGTFNASSTRMSKRGSSLLRYALILAANNVQLNTKTFSSYYNTKRAQGKLHYNALGHCAGKLVRTIIYMLKNNVKFNLD